MSTAFVAVLAASLASAAETYLPLPGYSPEAATVSKSDFPPDETLLGAADNPLDVLVKDKEELRDALISPPSVAWLMKGLRAPVPADRLATIHSAAIPRHVSAVPHLTGVLLRLDEKPELRAAAATALGRIGDAVAAPGLIEALDDPSPEVRYAAALALGRLPTVGAATRLSRTVRSDPSWWVRYAAVLSLGRTKKGFVVSALEDCLQQEPKWQIRMLAVRSLQDVGGPRAAEALSRALRDKDSGVRMSAALSLAEIGGNIQLDSLRDALQAETDPSARSAQSAAFQRILAKL
jgi:hypothetical protein